MKIILIVVEIIILLIAIVFVGGALIPRKHTATRSAIYKLSPEQIYQIISDHASHPSWRSDLKSVEILAPRNGHVVFRENSSSGPIMMEVTESAPPNRYITKIADDELAFGGTWTFQIEPAAGGARLRITEDGEVKNPIFRFMSKFVFGQTATMETYLKSLAKKAGHAISIES